MLRCQKLGLGLIGGNRGKEIDGRSVYPLRLPVKLPAKNVTPPFNPASISGCSLWLDASDSSTITFSSGVKVSNWKDKSGKGNNYQQPTVSAQPTLSLDSVYNKSGMKFTNGSTSLFAPASTSNIITSANFTMFVVVRWSDSALSTVQTITRGGNGNWIRWQSGAISFNMSPKDLQYTTTVTNVAGVFTFSVSSTSQAIFKNGTQVSVTTRSGTVVNDNIYLGANTSGGEGMTGYIFEFLLYNNTTLTNTQQQAIEAYLKTKWGI